MTSNTTKYSFRYTSTVETVAEMRADSVVEFGAAIIEAIQLSVKKSGIFPSEIIFIAPSECLLPVTIELRKVIASGSNYIVISSVADSKKKDN